MRSGLLVSAVACLSLPCASVAAQWEMQDSHVAADLRGIDYVGGGVAWASGSHGTVLRTEDMGFVWQLCATPPEGKDLDFRGVQAFDNNTAIVMSSGPGNKSRLYKTTDGCQTWKLVLADPYGPQGFFDALVFLDRDHGVLLGDPTGPTPFTPSEEQPGNFRMRVTPDAGETWIPISPPNPIDPGHGLHAESKESAFAASNTSLVYKNGRLWFATSLSRVSTRVVLQSKATSHFLFEPSICAGAIDPVSHTCGLPWNDFTNGYVPIHHDTLSSGIFSIAFQDALRGIAVGGDYTLPNSAGPIAACTNDGGRTWTAAVQEPHGYRSAVQFALSAKYAIAVGPNGTDISTDDGRNWQALKPRVGDAPDADKNWNALSLPFVVGPKGRIGILQDAALAGQAKSLDAKDAK